MPLTNLSPNSTFLELLKMGFEVSFPNGCRLKGDPADSYIECYTAYGPDGRWLLNEDGLMSAINDAESYDPQG